MKLVLKKKDATKPRIILPRTPSPEVEVVEMDEEYFPNNIIGKEIMQNVKKELHMTVADLRGEAKSIQDNTMDVLVPVRDLEFSRAKGAQVMFRLGHAEIGKSVLTQHALSQLGSRYGIPQNYVRKCAGRGYTDLIQDNYREWMKDDKATVMLREFENDEGTMLTRAVLSDKYKTFDTPEILESLCSNVDFRKNWHVRQYLMNPERFHLRLVSDLPLDVPEEDLYVGMTIDSSDVGRSSLIIRCIIFKQVCSNGLILPKDVGDLYRQPHVGDGADKFGDRIAACLSAVGRVKEIAETMISNLMENENSNKLPFDIGDEEGVEKFRTSHELPKNLMVSIIDVLNEERYGKPTKWALINSMTDVAQSYSLDARLEIERVAGRLLIAA